MSDMEMKEARNKVVITAEDCKTALDFWKHFEIPIPAPLQSALDTFSAEPSFENQQEVKYQICNAIVTTDHEAFKDEMFKKIVEECGNVVYDMSFDKNLHKVLSDDSVASEENKA